ncbi:MAG: dockerin type I domain-containing protein, partial [Clostridium sp.]
LNLYLNNISDISQISTLTKLKNVSFEKNVIADCSPLSNLSTLESIDLTGNYISEISSLSSLPQLKNLSVNSNAISDISCISNFKALENFNFMYNPNIKDITPLKACSTLKAITLTGETITDYTPFADCTFNIDFMDSFDFLQNSTAIKDNNVILQGLPKIKDKDGTVYSVNNAIIFIGEDEYTSGITEGDNIIIDRDKYPGTYVNVNVYYSLSVGKIQLNYRVLLNADDFSYLDNIKDDRITAIGKIANTTSKKYANFAPEQWATLEAATSNSDNFKLFKGVFLLLNSLYRSQDSTAQELKTLITCLKNIPDEDKFSVPDIGFMNDIFRNYLSIYKTRTITEKDRETLTALKELVDVFDNLTQSLNDPLYNSLKGDLLKIIDKLPPSKDFNGDGVVDVIDLSLLGEKYNMNSESEGFEVRFDLNGDKIIDLYDLVNLANLL